VATLVASAASPDDVFVAVTREVRQLLEADASLILRLDPDGVGTVVARLGEQVELMPVGSRWTPEPPLATAIALRTGRSARVDDNSAARGAFADVIHRVGLRSAVATPIIVDGRVWGVISVATTRESLAADTERRLVDFTELVATAISNAASRAQLAASRARIVATADETRRRIERDLHDGIQQRLVTLALEVRTVIDSAARDELRVPLSRVVDGLKEALDELREISRGVHPANLSGGGLASALKSVARRSALPVALDITGVGRLPQPVEVAAYYTVSEALANAAKHAGASRAEVTLHVDNGTLHLSISDDGVGGADPARGSGIIGLSDRVEALGGSITLISPPGKGTSLVLQLPAAAG
jgi:signal transduction histidine kinase